jgi:tetraacyldisaccharide 4'-kinase
VSAGPPAFWQRRGLPAVLLLPAAALFATVAAARRLAYATRLRRAPPLPVPVVVVGNITAGGTGKTPLVIHLAQALAAAGRRPGIVTRGYGGIGPEPARVGADADAAQCGDEAVLLATALAPLGIAVVRAADRVSAARALLAAQPQVDVLLADDGLQHLRLVRCVEIAVVDGSRGLGNGWPLPAGPLREPPSRLTRVDAVVVKAPATVAVDTRGVPTFAMTLQPQRFVPVGPAGDTRAPRGLDTWRGQRVHAVAGIGHPDHFFASLRALGIEVVAHAFADHHAFTARDLAFGDDLPIVMTAKDAVKCRSLALRDAWALDVRAIVAPDLAAHVLTLLRNADGR